MKKLFWALVALLILGSLYYTKEKGQSLSTTTPPKAPSDNIAMPVPNKNPGVVAQKLQIPWAIVFLPDGTQLFTERPGRVRAITANGKLLESPVFSPKDVKTIGEGGLLGIEIHPNFIQNKYVYLYYTYGGDGDRTQNKVVRYNYENGRFTGEKILISNIPGNSNHNGGRLKFGPDGFLYITTGDSQEPSLSQDTNSLAGKILRTTDEGSVVSGNPFSNLTYSYGHRNPQGLAWDENGQLWSAEHGPSAGDEVNRIVPGKNYGWPTITRSQAKEGMETPVLHSGSNTWAPSGLVYIKPYLYFAGLRSNTLYRYNTQTQELKSFLQREYGRLRDVVLGTDGMLYILTSNMDGRSITHLDGDKIIRIDPFTLK